MENLSYDKAKRLPCVAHNFQLTLKEALNESNDVYREIEKVVYFVSKSKQSDINEKLVSVGIDLHKRHETRWRSQFNTIKSFLEIKTEDFDEIFGFPKEMSIADISYRDIITEILSDLVSVSKDIDEIIKMIQEDESFSFGLILPLSRCLKYNIDKLKCDTFIETLKKSCSRQFDFLESNTIYSIACLLIPKFGKDLERYVADKTNNIVLELKTNIKDYVSNFNISKINNSKLSESSELNKPPSQKSNILTFFESNVNTENFPKSIEISVDDYLKLIKTHHFELKDTKKFWLQHEKEWPELGSYAKFVLSIPTWSALVERVFNLNDIIPRPRRQRLNDDVLRKLLFLKFNQELI